MAMGMKCTRPSKWKELLLLVCVFFNDKLQISSHCLLYEYLRVMGTKKSQLSALPTVKLQGVELHVLKEHQVEHQFCHINAQL